MEFNSFNLLASIYSISAHFHLMVLSILHNAIAPPDNCWCLFDNCEWRMSLLFFSLKKKCYFALKKIARMFSKGLSKLMCLTLLCTSLEILQQGLSDSNMPRQVFFVYFNGRQTTFGALPPSSDSKNVFFFLIYFFSLIFLFVFI